MPASADVVKPEPAWYRRAVPTLYMLLIACSFAGVLIYKLRVDGIFACPAGGYDLNAFLCDCTARNYGDYDHGAFWYGLEPEARLAAADAQVLFVGSSRLQLAMSTAATSSWFSAPGIRYYLLGFSNSETVAFFGPLFSKIRPRARAYVINVDRFFDERVSPPTEDILRSRDTLERYEDKQTWQVLHRRLCAELPFVCGSAVAIFRARETGVWRRMGSGRLEARPVSDGQPSNVERWNQYAALGEKFLAQLPVDRNCVILTIVPTVETKRAEAAAIAARLGLELLTPQIEGLRTFDGSHLDEASAERWSEAFLREAGPRIRRCVDVAQGTAG